MEQSVACLQVPETGLEAQAAVWPPDARPDAFLGSQLAGRYRVFCDGRDPRRPVRYVAMAQSLAIRPYAVVTSDLGELRRLMQRGASAA
jgi:hypothetical protein